MKTLWQDLRYAVRMLWQRPGFTLVAVVTLALGIGANAAIFSVVNAVLLRSLPFREAGRLVTIRGENLKSGDGFGASPADFRDWREQTKSFEAFASHSGGGVNLISEEQPESVPGERVTEDYFKVYDVKPLLGRTFAPDEFKVGSNVIVLSHRLWQRRFAGDPALVGKPISIGGRPVTVIGVMPPEYKQPAYAEVWTPLGQDSAELKPRGNRYFSVSARLKSGVTYEQAAAEMRVVTARLAEQYPETNSNWSARVTPLRESLVGDSRAPLLMLLGAVGCVLFIASLNVSNLLLTRATSRHKEIAVRAALGATRWRVARQLITESLLLSVMGGIGGVLLAFWGVDAIVALVPKDLYFALLDETRVDLTVLGFAFAISLLTGVLLGVIPALQASRPDLNESLKESGRGASASLRQQRTRNLLVIAEVAITLVLLIGAGLLVRSLASLRGADLGFDPRNLIAVGVNAPAQDAKGIALYERFAAETAALPGVKSVAASSSRPLESALVFPFTIEGRAATSGDLPQATYSAISPNYFRTMGIPLQQGREFTERDRRGATDVAIINESMRQRFFPDEDPLGKRVTIDYLGTPLTLEIVGVARDAKLTSVSEKPATEIYVSYLQRPWLSMNLLIRTAGDADGFVAPVKSAIRGVDKSQTASYLKTVEQLFSDSLARPRFYTLLLGAFAALALLLAAIGLYGVISYSVTQRAHEIGVRMALGARGADVLRMVVGQGLALAAIGIGVGLVCSLLATRVLTSSLYEVSALDPVTIVSVSALLFIVALAACLIPARRATKVDPLVALRYE